MAAHLGAPLVYFKSEWPSNKIIGTTKSVFAYRGNPDVATLRVTA